MRMMSARIRSSAAAESGFTMIIAIGVMLVTSLLLVAAFTIAQGDSQLSGTDTNQKQAYYAALAGVQQYEYKLQANPNYWESCEQPSGSLPGESNAKWEVKLLPAMSGKMSECSKTSPFTSMIESQGTLANTFRIKATGTVGGEKRAVVATFRVEGFLDFIYFTNYETEDPGLYSAPTGCENAYYKEWHAKGLGCQAIVFTSGDKVEGPMHTNDAADVEGTASFGREGHSPPDKVEINGGTYPEDSGGKCTGSPKFFTESKCYTSGRTLIPPENDTSLEAYVEPGYMFEGATKLVLNGETGKITATYYTNFTTGEKKEESLPWPANGLIYVKASETTGCGYTFSPSSADTSTETSTEKGCGTVYVQGSYSKSLTVAGEDDLIINGNIYPSSVAGSLGSEPTGTTTLGLIASNYVRVYHPCSGGVNGAGSLSSPWIYAAILSTKHSFIADNYACGAALGNLSVYGAIAQDYRGPVGNTGGNGYIKNYKYDGRLATAEPPYFLAPLKAGWKIIRETAPTPG